LSLFKKKDYTNDTKRATGRVNNRIVMKKQKIPTDMKTVYSICPVCSKKGYVKSKKYCKNCKFQFTPEKEITWKKFNLF